MRWFTSDHHFFHDNVIKYCNRPFKDVWDMNSELIRRWNNLVKTHDIVFYLGDFHWTTFEGRKLKAPEISQTIRKLNGEKVLIKGNHDKGLSSNKWRQAGMANVLDSHQIEIAGRSVNLSHYPYRGNEHDHRTSKRQIDDDGNWLLHGHCHHHRPKLSGERMINVGVDVWDFAPVSEGQILELIAPNPE